MMTNTERDFHFDQTLLRALTRIREEFAEADLYPVLVITRQRATERIVVLQPDFAPSRDILDWLEQAAIAYTLGEGGA